MSYQTDIQKYFICQLLTITEMKKILIICALIALLAGCTTQKVSYTILKREYKENRFTKQFYQADSMFNEKYILYEN